MKYYNGHGQGELETTDVIGINSMCLPSVCFWVLPIKFSYSMGREWLNRWSRCAVRLRRLSLPEQYPHRSYVFYRNTPPPSQATDQGTKYLLLPWRHSLRLKWFHDRVQCSVTEWAKDPRRAYFPGLHRRRSFERKWFGRVNFLQLRVMRRALREHQLRNTCWFGCHAALVAAWWLGNAYRRTVGFGRTYCTLQRNKKEDVLLSSVPLRVGIEYQSVVLMLTIF